MWYYLPVQYYIDQIQGELPEGLVSLPFRESAGVFPPLYDSINTRSKLQGEKIKQKQKSPFSTQKFSSQCLSFDAHLLPPPPKSWLAFNFEKPDVENYLVF